MLKDITIGQYLPLDSFIHRLDPRTKIIATMMFIVGLFLVNNIYAYIIVMVYVIFCIMISKIPFKFIVRGLRPIVYLIIFTSVLNLFFTTGEKIVFTLGPFNIYEESIIRTVFLIFRLLFMIIGTSIMTLTTSPIELTDGIENLLNPFRRIGLPAHEIAMMLTIALRFIPTLMDETDKIMKAQMSRGAELDSKNIIKKAKNLIPILIPLFISSFRRADELAMAMEARCYRGGEGRTRVKKLVYLSKDYIAFIVSLIYLSLCIGSRFV